MKKDQVLQTVLVVVYGNNSEKLNNARVSVQSPKADSFEHLTYDEGKQAYLYQVPASGIHTIRVEAAGLEDQERRIKLPFTETQRTIPFFLGEPGTRYTYFNGAKKPMIEVDHDEIVIIPFVNPRESKQKREKTRKNVLADLSSKIALVKEKKDKIPSGDAVTGNVFKLTKRTKGSKNRKEELKTIRQHPGVAEAGFKIPSRTSNGEFSILLNEVAAGFDTTLSEEQIAVILESFPLKSFWKLPFGTNYYQLNCDDTVGEEIHDIIERLNLLDTVQFANPVLLDPARPASPVVPNDFYWPAQWDKHLLNLENAWGEMVSTAPFGDRNITIAVVDEGIKTSGGEADNIDFQDVPGTLPAGTLTAAIAPPRTTITLQSSTGFSVGHKVRVGVEKDLEIYSKSGNDLEIDALLQPHKAKVEVVNQNNTSVSSFLQSDIDATVSTLNVSMSSGTFTAGSVLSIGGLTATNWEDVIIVDVTGTVVTTTPVRRSHASGKVLVQGRKLHRVFDFRNNDESESFGPDNDDIPNDHGINCASVSAGNANKPDNVGAVGVAPNVSLIGVLRSSYNEFPGASGNLSRSVATLRQFLWSAGLVDHEYDGGGSVTSPLRLVKGADVITCSIQYGGSSSSLSRDPNEADPDLLSIAQEINTGLNKLVRRGRNGRGIPTFFAVGNDTKVVPASQWSSHPMIMGIAASTYNYHPSSGVMYEYFADYTNFTNLPQPALPGSTRIAFSAPSNSNSAWSDRVTPNRLGIIAAAEKGWGNLVNESEDQVITTDPFIVPKTTLVGTHLAGATELVVAAGTIFSDFPGDPDNCWIKIGDLESTSEWVQIIDHDIPNYKFILSSPTIKEHADTSVISRVKTTTTITESLPPNAVVIPVSSVSGFNVGDWIRIGQQGYPIYWKQITDINVGDKTLEIDSAISTGWLQLLSNSKQDLDEEFAAAVATGSGATSVQVNTGWPGSADQVNYIKIGQYLEITTSAGVQQRIVTDIVAGSTINPPGGSYIACKVLLKSALTGSVAINNVVVSKVLDTAPVVTGSSTIKVDDASAFTAGKWAFIGTPGNNGDPMDPRLESTHVQSIDTGNNTITISGPHYAHPQNTVIHQSGSADYTDRFGGTSEATPQVAGLAALLLSRNPQLTWVEVKEIIRSTAYKITTDTIPPTNTWKLDNGLDYNNKYGFGRIQPFEAVKEAKRYLTENDRDLCIRDYLVFNTDGTVSEDDCISGTDLSLYTINSPDIWTRRSGEADPAAIPSILTYSTELPPNENATINGDRMIYVRVKNRSQEVKSLQAWLRVYLVLTSGRPDVSFPKYFDDELSVSGYIANKTGVYYLGERELFDLDESTFAGDNQYTLDHYGGIRGDDGPFVIDMPWAEATQPPVGTHKHTYVAAEILPYDGPLAEPEVNRNGNISYRRILFTDIKILENVSGEVALKKFYQFDPANPTINFKALVRDAEYLPAKHIRIVYERTKSTGETEQTEFAFNGTTFAQVGELNNISFDQPVTTSGSPNLYTFTGTITLTADLSAVAIRVIVMEPDLAEEDPLSPVLPLIIREQDVFTIQIYSIPDYSLNPSDGMAPSSQPKPYMFTDFAELAPQTDDNEVLNESFRKVDRSHFHITSLFKAANPGNPIPAYAAAPGQVFVQKADNDRVNLILRPFEQSGLGTTAVKYFVYRGLKLTDFLAGPSDPQDKQVRSRTGASAFIESLYQENDNRNNATTPAGTNTVSPLAFGYDPENQIDPERSIDDYFLSPDDDHQLKHVTKGMVLGHFVNDGTLQFGFEIILVDGKFQPSLSYARATDFSLEITPAVTETGIEPVNFNVYSKREEVLSFMDPVAYLGNHYFSGIQTNAEPLKGEPLYTSVLSKFNNYNRLYLDIRNSSNYSFNYEKNYAGADGIPNAENNLKVLLNNGEYDFAKYDRDWPVYFRVSTSAYDSNSGFVNFKLRTADNTSPVVYIQHGVVTSPKTNERFINKDLLIDTTDTSFTKPINLLWPVTGSSGSFRSFVAGHLKLHYGRRLPSGTDPEGGAFPIGNYADNVFGPLESAIQKRGIDGIDAPNKLIRLTGDYSLTIRSGDVVRIESSAANNGIYTIDTVEYNLTTKETDIQVNEPIPGATAPLGQLVFSYHLWKVDLPAKWFSGFRRTFIDAETSPVDTSTEPDTPLLGFACMADTGMAFDDNRVIFFASPAHYLKRNDSRAVNQVNLNGGVGPSDSVWIEIIKRNPRLQLSASILKISASEFIPLFEFEQTDENGANERKENFMALCITETEFNQVKRALFESTLNQFHEHYLKLVNTSETESAFTDLNGLEYFKYELAITGWTGPAEGPCVYTEIPTSTTAHTNPVYVYALKDNPLIFTSQDFALLEETEVLTEKYDEGLRMQQEALTLLANDPTIYSLVTGFETDFDALGDETPALSALVEDTAKTLFESAVSNAGTYDDRPLYWSRLHLRAAIRSNSWSKKQLRLIRRLIETEEGFSRGISTIDFTNGNPAFSAVNTATAKKVLIAGFDPLSVNKDLGTISKKSVSAIAALNLHNQVINSGGETAMIQCVLLPGRYNDFSNKSIQSVIKNSVTGAGQADMILVLGDNQADRFEIERYAAKAVSTDIDNELGKKESVSGSASYLTTNLPVDDMVSLVTQPRVYFDQSFQFSGGNQASPAEGGPDQNTDSNGVVPSGRPIAGSGGNTFANFYFYNFLSKAHKESSTTRIGLISLPKPGGNWNSYSDIISRLTTIIGQALTSI